MAALFLASKTEESLVRISHLSLVYDHLIQRARQCDIIPLDAFSQRAYDMKNDLVVAEMQLLKHLAFDVSVQLPYGLMVNYLRILGLEDHPEVPNKSWGYLNDG
jgi:cyclin L